MIRLKALKTRLKEQTAFNRKNLKPLIHGRQTFDMLELDNEIKYLLFKSPLKKNLAYNSTRGAFRDVKLRETAKFALLQKYGYTITSSRSPISGDSILLVITPPAEGVDSVVNRVMEQDKAKNANG